MPTHNINVTWSRGSESIENDVSLTADAESGGDFAIPSGSVDLEINLDYDISELECFVMVADQALTVKTNSTGAPDDTIALLANTPIIQYTGDGRAAGIFDTDITKLYVTNASGSSATLKIRALFDGTP
jgi:hypothetical protein